MNLDVGGIRKLANLLKPLQDIADIAEKLQAAENTLSSFKSSTEAIKREFGDWQKKAEDEKIAHEQAMERLIAKAKEDSDKILRDGVAACLDEITTIRKPFILEETEIKEAIAKLKTERGDLAKDILNAKDDLMLSEKASAAAKKQLDQIRATMKQFRDLV
jgi:DNA repair exonuclease SbcCD ATPase subunit